MLVHPKKKEKKKHIEQKNMMGEWKSVTRVMSIIPGFGYYCFGETMGSLDYDLPQMLPRSSSL